MQAKTLRINCYVRIKASGYVGKLGSIYHHEGTRSRTFGVDWASEYQWDELERISPAEYHASPSHLKLSRTVHEAPIVQPSALSELEYIVNQHRTL